MAYPDPTGPKEIVATWALTGAIFLGLVIASLFDDKTLNRLELIAVRSLGNVAETHEPVTRHSKVCCLQHDERKAVARMP